LQSGHPGIQGILGLRLYRHGQIYPETVMKAFFDHKSQLLKAA
jgi:hypothetical protein